MNTFYVLLIFIFLAMMNYNATGRIKNKIKAKAAIKTVLEEVLSPTVGMTSSGAAPMTLKGIDAKTAFRWSNECMRNHIEAFADKHGIELEQGE